MMNFVISLKQNIIYDDFVSSEFGDDWNAFLKKNRFKLHLRKKGGKSKGLSLDVMYDYMHREAPQFAMYFVLRSF